MKQNDILRFVRANPGSTMREITLGLGGRVEQVGEVGNSLGKMMRRGRLRREGRGWFDPFRYYATHPATAPDRYGVDGGSDGRTTMDDAEVRGQGDRVAR